MWEPQVSVRFSQPPRGSCPERPPRVLAAGGDTPLEPLTLCEPRPDGGHFAVALRPRRPGRTVAPPPRWPLASFLLLLLGPSPVCAVPEEAPTARAMLGPRVRGEDAGPGMPEAGGRRGHR